MCVHALPHDDRSAFVGLVDRLPGVFTGNPYPLAVNGSLWTLAIEVYCYGALAAVAAFGALRRPWLAVAVAAGCSRRASCRRRSSRRCRATARSPRRDSPARSSRARLLRMARSSRRQSLGRAGAARRDAALRRVERGSLRDHGCDRVRDPHARLPPWLDLAFFRRFGDASYGVYVYAFPTQQAIAAVVGAMSPLLLFALAFPVVVLIAAASWAWLEKPALRWGAR